MGVVQTGALPTKGILNFKTDDKLPTPSLNDLGRSERGPYLDAVYRKDLSEGLSSGVAHLL